METKHPGSERELDQQRPGGGARYHGASWSDAEESRAEGPEMQELDALPEAVHSADQEGMGGMGHEYRRHRKNPTHEPPPDRPREIRAEPAPPTPATASSTGAKDAATAIERDRHVPERH
jgi:hypothetical protein